MFDSNEDWAVRQAYEKGREDERADAYLKGLNDERDRIVVWLRGRAERLRVLSDPRATHGAAALLVAAELIEAKASADVA